eukprot:7356348-Ditylum_brightwellii.AAC.1
MRFFDNGNKGLCIANLLSAIPVSYEHGLTVGSINMRQLELMEDYHTVMGLQGDIIQYQLLSQTGLSGLMCRENNKPDNCGFKPHASNALDVVQLQDDDDDDANFIQGIRQRLELVKTKNIQTWLEENTSWNPMHNKRHNVYIPNPWDIFGNQLTSGLGYHQQHISQWQSCMSHDLRIIPCCSQ